MKLVIFGLGFSPNLGDGVIADCLTHAVQGALPGAEVVALDLSGRTGFGEVMVAGRTRVLKLLGTLPLPLRHALVRWRLGRMLDAIEPRWQTAAGSCSRTPI